MSTEFVTVPAKADIVNISDTSEVVVIESDESADLIEIGTQGPEGVGGGGGGGGVSDHGALTGLSDDDHPQYLNQARGDARYYTQAQTDTALAGKETAGAAAVVQTDLDSHKANVSNPHSVTKAQVGLSNVDNTSDLNKPISTATQTALDAKEAVANKGAAGGYAPLDGSTKIPAAYLPSYVDDVEEYANLGAFPGTGESGKIYVAIDSGKIYRWTGSVYAEISPSPGSTDSVSEGSVNLYFTTARVLATVLAGLSTATNAVITASDTILQALGKLQAQITARLVASNNLSDVGDAATARTNLGVADGEFSFTIDGAGSALETGIKKAFVRVPFTCTVKGWQIVADQSGSIVVDILKSTYASFPPAASIAGTEKPTLSSAQKNEDLTLTSFSTSLTKGDYLDINVESASTVTRVIVTLIVEK